MIPKDFPSREELARVKAENDMYRMYNADEPLEDTDRWKWRLKEFFENDKQKAKILDTIDHICPVIVNGTTDFLFGEKVRVKVNGDNPELQKKIDDLMDRNKLSYKLGQSSALVQSAGHGHFKAYRAIDGKAVIEEVPYDYVFPNWKNVPQGEESKDNRIVVYLKGDDGNDYMYIEEWYMDGINAFVAKSLWEDNLGRTGNQVPLSTLGITAAEGATEDGLTMIEATGLTQYPFFTINGRKTVKERFAQSEFKKILPLLHRIEDGLTQLSVQFLKHLNPKLQIPANAVTRDANGKVNTADLEVFLAQAGDPDTKYITNDNPLIEQMFTHLDKLVRKVAKRAQVPDSWLIEDEKGGVESVESLRTRLLMFLKKIKFYQTAYEGEIIRMIRVGLEIEGESEAKNVSLQVIYDPGLPKEWKDDVSVWGDALTNGLASKETAVARFQGIEGEDLEAELSRITEDEKQMAMTSMNSDPNLQQV
jgi:hypothetical protein